MTPSRDATHLVPAGGAAVAQVLGDDELEAVVGAVAALVLDRELGEEVHLRGRRRRRWDLPCSFKRKHLYAQSTLLLSLRSRR